jgi:predicted GH43/DUF377 family glycosyl hydrolase
MRGKRVAVVVSIVLCCVGSAVGQTRWIYHPDNPVVPPGDPGSWDDGARIATSVLFDGAVYHMWFAGVNAAGVLGDIGHATSDDGVEWTMDPGNPVLTRGVPGAWDDQFVIISTVVYDGAQFHMWYTGWHGGRERIGYATSPDGSAWTKYWDNPVIDVGPPGSWYALQVRPGQVIDEGGTYKMWLAGLEEGSGVARIGYAESADGISWQMLPDPILQPGQDPGAWDAFRVVNPTVVSDGSAYHMLYAGTRIQGSQEIGKIGYAFSSDGIHWTKHRDNPVIETSDDYAVFAPMIFDGATFFMWCAHGYIPGVASYAWSDCCAGIFGDDFETGDTSLWSSTVP